MPNSAMPNRSTSKETVTDSLLSRFRLAADMLEEIVADRTILADIPEADRNRFLNAAGRVSRPDAIDRRQLLKVVKRKRRLERVERQESLLAETGIRKLRRERVMITSPNIFPPKTQLAGGTKENAPDTEEPRNCYCLLYT